MSNMLTRILVAFVGIPLMVFICLQGGWLFAGFVALLSVLGVREFYALSTTKAAQPQSLGGLLVAGLLPLVVHYDTTAILHLTMPLLIASVLLLMSIELWRRKPHPFVNLSVQFSAWVYVSLLLSTLVLVRDFDASNGALHFSGIGTHAAWQGYLLLCMFITVWSGDSAAYFAGLAWGKHKIFPRVSPKKSWEGSIAGFIASVFAFHLASHFLIPELPMMHGFMMGAVIGVVGPVGDFVESLLKRDAAIKDSSSLIPGHGGVLDRFDSILFAAPAMYGYLMVMSI